MDQNKTKKVLPNPATDPPVSSKKPEEGLHSQGSQSRNRSGRRGELHYPAGKCTAWKLIVDPDLKQGPKKVWSCDGKIPGQGTREIPVVDPRISSLKTPRQARYKVPRFVVDSNYVGPKPSREVTLKNLNDNVNEKFLKEHVSKFGPVQNVTVYYHPFTRKHLGVGHVTFENYWDASTCAAKLNGRPLMGMTTEVFCDTKGAIARKLRDELINPSGSDSKSHAGRCIDEVVLSPRSDLDSRIQELCGENSHIGKLIAEWRPEWSRESDCDNESKSHLNSSTESPLPSPFFTPTHHHESNHGCPYEPIMKPNGCVPTVSVSSHDSSTCASLNSEKSENYNSSTCTRASITSHDTNVHYQANCNGNFHPDHRIYDASSAYQSNYLQSPTEMTPAATVPPSTCPSVADTLGESEYREILKQAVKDKIESELRPALRRDCNKKLIEGHAFRIFENWWDSSEAAFKKKEEEEENARKLSAQMKSPESVVVQDTSVCGRIVIPKLSHFRLPKKFSPEQDSETRSKAGTSCTTDDDNEVGYNKPNQEKPQSAKTSWTFSEMEVEDISSDEDNFESESYSKNEEIGSESDSPMSSHRTRTTSASSVSPLYSDDTSVSPKSSFTNGRVRRATMLDDLTDDELPQKKGKFESPKSSGHTLSSSLLKVSRTKKPSPVKPFNPVCRDEQACNEIVSKFLIDGLDSEDIENLKTVYDEMYLSDNVSLPLWVDHAVPETNQITSTPKVPCEDEAGSLRTRGFVKMARKDKLRLRLSRTHTSSQIERWEKNNAAVISLNGKLSHRDARTNHRRLALELEGTESDFIKLNQLSTRKKALYLEKSKIHEWGLFTAEAIAADEMIIEYVGEIIRSIVTDSREARYEKDGVGDSYFFRMDDTDVIDATRLGNMSRFINHSCTPNCYAKLITIKGVRKLVIYSKQAIAPKEELTYDYKFPYEAVKIRCLCGTSQCRGFLN